MKQHTADALVQPLLYSSHVELHNYIRITLLPFERCHSYRYFKPPPEAVGHDGEGCGRTVEIGSIGSMMTSTSKKCSNRW